MPVMNDKGYVERRAGKGKKRNWYLVKEAEYKRGIITVNDIRLPTRFIGKRVRVKIEVVEDEE